MRAIACGEFLFGAIDGSGAVHTWGLNIEGALGRQSEQVNAGPDIVSSLPPARQLAVGKGYMLALTRDGDVYAWGSNGAGQLGPGISVGRHTAAVAFARENRSIAAGATHCSAVTTDGRVLAWGGNHHGQLGRCECAYAARPVHVELSEPIRAIAAGMHFSLALSEAGNVYAWGWNGHGQLGLNDTADRWVATRIRGLEHVQAIAAGETHAVALTAVALSGWGNNSAGQIGAINPVELQPTTFLTLRHRPRTKILETRLPRPLTLLQVSPHRPRCMDGW
jgi:alpha-tubulin suppressor-like RCC1 family protein